AFGADAPLSVDDALGAAPAYADDAESDHSEAEFGGAPAAEYGEMSDIFAEPDADAPAAADDLELSDDIFLFDDDDGAELAAGSDVLPAEPPAWGSFVAATTEGEPAEVADDTDADDVLLVADDDLDDDLDDLNDGMADVEPFVSDEP